MLEEFEALGVEVIEVRCGDVAVMETDVAPAEVIGEDEEDVGARSR
jgi:hypothetical protein